jgi:hypothetical protein
VVFGRARFVGLAIAAGAVVVDLRVRLGGLVVFGRARSVGLAIAAGAVLAW